MVVLGQRNVYALEVGHAKDTGAMVNFCLSFFFLPLTDFSHGDYGRGLYFSKYPSKAAQFSAVSSH